MSPLRAVSLVAPLFVIMAMTASAAITFDTASFGGVGTAFTASWSHTVGTGANRMLVVGISTERDTDNTPSGVTYGSQALTKVPGSFAKSNNTVRLSTELWYLVAPNVGTAQITATFATSVVNGIQCGAVSLFGVQQGAPEAVAVATGTQLDNGTLYSLPITTLTNGAWLVDIAANGSVGDTFATTTTGMTERWDNNVSGQLSQAGATREVATAGLVTDTWTASPTSNRKSQSIAAFAPAPTNQPLAVAITSPANNATVGASFTITADATVGPATITSVTFFDGATQLGVDTTNPYSFAVTGAAPGSHALTAVALDSTNASLTSAVVNVTVANQPPAVSLTSPAEASAFTVGTNVTLDATASDDTAVSQVEFFVDNVLLSTDTSSPYSASWNNVALGAHTLKAVATDGAGLTTTSTVVNVTVTGFGALQFDGVNDHVTMGTATALGAQTFTLECWVKHDPSGTGRATASSGNGGVNIYPLISKGRGEGDGSNVDCNYIFGLQADGRLAADFEDLNTGLNHPIVGTNAVPSDTWKHVAVTYDGSTWRFYIDGVPDNSLTISGTGNVLVPRYDSIQHFGLGTAMTSAGTTQGFFKGTMDEVRVWNVARTQAEIAGAMNSEISSATNLIGRWSLNETSGTAATNTGTASSVNGTLTNGPVRTTGYPFGPQPPSVAITNPADSAVLTPDFTIDATAADTDGTITSVTFFDGPTQLGIDTTSPYGFAVTGASTGSHSLTAVALDSSGLSTTSAAVVITVSTNHPPVVTPTAPANLATGIGASTTLSVGISDQDGDAQTVTFYGRQTTPATPGADFTFVAIPDTQFYSENTGRNPSAGGTGAVISFFNDQTDWITANRNARNIAFVAHMGDMVQNGDNIQQEWINADGAMRRIENPLTTLLAHGIPWGGAPGNHDFGSGGGSGSTTYWNQYFGTSRWSGRSYFKGNYGADNTNNYQIFSASGLDFIVINLAYRTTADTAVHDWADALLKAYPNHRAIVTSHWIINTGNPATFGGQGQAIYDNLKDNPNLFFLLCGHVHGEGRRQDVFQSRTVHSVLQDYQDGSNGGNGFLRTFTFSPANNLITAEMWSPTLNRTATTADIPTAQGVYTLPYNMQTAVTDWIPLGTANVAANGTTASLNWTGLAAGKTYEWYATSNDSISTAGSATRSFSTTANLPPSVAITSPANNAAFTVPASVNITANAADSDGTVTKVEFYQGTTKLGEDTAAPYEFTWSGAPSGAHVLTAIALDNTGEPALSAAVNITITNPANVPPTVSITAPADNAVLAAGATIILTASAVDGDGTITKVEFFNGTTKLGEDTTSPYAFTWNSVPAGSYTLTAKAFDNDGGITTSGAISITTATPISTTLIAKDSVWKYRDNGSDQGTAWRAAAFNDTAWASGAAELGYADSPATTVSYGPDSNNKYITTYFRRAFTVANPASVSVLAMTLVRDDGAVIYLNGTEIARSNMDAGTVLYNTLSTNAAVGGADESTYFPITFSVDPIPLLVSGTNVLAVEIHQQAVTSSDLSFNLDLIAQTLPIGSPPSVSITSPANAASFTAPATVNITANASDTDGTVSKVEFFQGAVKLGEDTSAPYAFTTPALAAGGYSLTASATDNDGNVITSAAVAITVITGPSGSLTRGPYLNMPNHNSIVVRWRSSQSIVGRVRYGLAPDALTLTADEAGAQTNHVVRLTGLSPYTRYYYSVGSALDTLTPELTETTSFKPAGTPVPTAADYTFRTSPVPGTAVNTRVWIVGDCGRGTQVQADGREAYYNFTGNRTPDLNLQMGDNAYNSGTDAEYQTGYFNMYVNSFRKMPQWSTLGNHDASNGDTNPASNHPYFDMFTFPTAAECGGAASGTEHYYSFDYGNIHFICLDSQASNTNTIETNGSDGPMAIWLRQDLASTTSTWIIAFWHHPPYSKGSHNSDTEGQMVNMRTNFNPILENGGVDLVFLGHSHNYERSILLDGFYGRSDQSPGITAAMKKNAGNGSTTGFTTTANGKIRNAANGFTATNTVAGAVIPADGAYIKPLTGPRDRFGAVYNTAGMSGLADSGAIDHSAMYVSYNNVGTVNLDVNGNSLTCTFVQSGGATPDNFTIIKQGAADSDGDGITDAYEIANGLNRKSAADATTSLDTDGLSNFLEFAFGLNPNVNDNGLVEVDVPGSLLTKRGTPTNWFQTTTNGTDFRVIFIRRKDAAEAGLVYTPEFSGDLVNWAPSNVTPTVVADGGEVEAVSINYPFFAAGRKARYFRVGVSSTH